MEAGVHLCCPQGAISALDQFLRGIADDWQSTQDLGEPLAKAKQAGGIVAIARLPHGDSHDHGAPTGGAVPAAAPGRQRDHYC
jgi:hypothetical protein